MLTVPFRELRNKAYFDTTQKLNACVLGLFPKHPLGMCLVGRFGAISSPAAAAGRRRLSNKIQIRAASSWLEGRCS